MTTREEAGLMARHGLTADEAREQATKNREARRQLWLDTAIDPYAQKHGITRQQALSVLFCDNTDGVTAEHAFWVEATDFAGEVMAAEGLKAWQPLGRQGDESSAPTPM